MSALISVGDTLLSVDGEDIQGLSVEEIALHIKGKVGSCVILGLSPFRHSMRLCQSLSECLCACGKRLTRTGLAEFSRRGYPDPFTVELTRIGIAKSSSSSQPSTASSSSKQRGDSSSSSRLTVVADPRSASGLKGLPPGLVSHHSSSLLLQWQVVT